MTPEVECMDLESSVIVEIPFIDDEAVSDEAPLGLVEDKSAEQPGSTAKMKGEFGVQYGSRQRERCTYFL